MALTASAPSQIYGAPNPVTLTATVSSSDGSVATGSVDFVNGATVLGTVPLTGGIATYQLPANTPAGTLQVVAKFTSDNGWDPAESAPTTITVNKATSAAALLATKTSYRQGSFLPALLFGVVVQNNGQRAQGQMQIKLCDANQQCTQVVDTVPVQSGVFWSWLPRSLKKGAYTYVATFVPSDPANVAGVDSNKISIQIR